MLMGDVDCGRGLVLVCFLQQFLLQTDSKGLHNYLYVSHMVRMTEVQLYSHLERYPMKWLSNLHDFQTFIYNFLFYVLAKRILCVCQEESCMGPVVTPQKVCNTFVLLILKSPTQCHICGFNSDIYAMRSQISKMFNCLWVLMSLECGLSSSTKFMHVFCR